MARSLRTRVVLGALLWTTGLLAAAHVISLAVLVRYPHLRLVAHGLLITVLALACMVAGFAQVRRGMSPFQALRDRLAAVRAGREHRVAGAYPAEVQPLVDDLNGLLEHRDQAVARAVARAGDLAHGLKTPLAVLAHEADRARAAGHEDLAAALSQQIDRMRRQIDYHLAHARASAGGTAADRRAPVAASIDGLVRALGRLHGDRGVTIETRVPGGQIARVQREDLEEMLGNLLDNACRAARTRVLVSSAVDGDRLVITVDDDGPGLAPGTRDAVLQRGVRADEAGPGTGFGLAIVRDLAELYDGSVALGAADLGGLRAVLVLPLASSPPHADPA